MAFLCGSKRNSYTCYFYVKNDNLVAVKKHGILSLRATASIYPDRSSDIVETHRNGFIEALADRTHGPNLLQFIEERGIENNTMLDRVLAYVDWSDSVTERGASSIYFLFAPIPDDATIRQFIKEKRGDFLKNMTLVSFTIDDTEDVQVVERTEDTTRSLFSKPKKFWMDQWDSEIERCKDSSDNTYWFQGITHGYIVPKCGRIKPNKIRIHKN
jgi:hypothetical protein